MTSSQSRSAGLVGRVDRRHLECLEGDDPDRFTRLEPHDEVRRAEFSEPGVLVDRRTGGVHPV